MKLRSWREKCKKEGRWVERSFGGAQKGEATWKCSREKDAVRSQGMLTAARSQKRQGMDSPLELWKGVALWMPWFWLLASRTPEKTFPVFEATQFVGLCYGSHRKSAQLLVIWKQKVEKKVVGYLHHFPDVRCIPVQLQLNLVLSDDGLSCPGVAPWKWEQ